MVVCTDALTATRANVSVRAVVVAAWSIASGVALLVVSELSAACRAATVTSVVVALREVASLVADIVCLPFVGAGHRASEL